MGAEVILASRDEKRGNQAAEEVRLASGSSKVWSMQLDLASLASVERFAKEVLAQHSSIDILVNNAGVMALPEREVTADGFEKQIGVNHLGHFRLTQLLMPALLEAGKRTGDARVVIVSSEAVSSPRVFRGWSDLCCLMVFQSWSGRWFMNARVIRPLAAHADPVLHGPGSTGRRSRGWSSRT